MKLKLPNYRNTKTYLLGYPTGIKDGCLAWGRVSVELRGGGGHQHSGPCSPGGISGDDVSELPLRGVVQIPYSASSGVSAPISDRKRLAIPSKRPFGI